MSVPAAKKLWQGIAIGFAIAFAYATVMAKLFHDWWNDENYSHGLLIPLIIGYIIWTQREKLARVPANSSVLWGGGAILFALFGLWAGVAGAELYTQRLSLILLFSRDPEFRSRLIFKSSSNARAPMPQLTSKLRLPGR